MCNRQLKWLISITILPYAPPASELQEYIYACIVLFHVIFKLCEFCLATFKLFSPGQIDAALQQGVEAVPTLVLNGFSNSITRFNLRQKYKHHKV